MDGNGIREASVIVAPPDTCTSCTRERVPAYETLYGRPMTVERVLIQGWYECPDCRFVWNTTWRIEPR